jgi:hypothetical protein
MFNRNPVFYLLLWSSIIVISASATEQKEEERLTNANQFLNTFTEYDSQSTESILLELTSKYRPTPYKLPTEEENTFLKLVATQFLEIANEEPSHPILKNIKEYRLKWLDCILKLGSNPPLQYAYNLQEGMWKKKLITPKEKYQIDMVESLIKSEIEVNFLERILKEFEYLSNYDGLFDLGTYDNIEDKSIEQRVIMRPEAECHSLILERVKEKQSTIEGIKNHLKRMGILRSGGS